MQEISYRSFRFITFVFLLPLVNLQCSRERDIRSDLYYSNIYCVGSFDYYELNRYAHESNIILSITNSSIDRIVWRELPNLIDRLSQLKLENNNILTILPGMFREFGHLQGLSLAHNKINNIIEGVFREIEHLQEINLSNNLINELKSHTFIGLQQLTYIDLSYNQLKQLPDDIFDYQTHIDYLNIAHNNFTSILNTDMIDKLNASFNQIQIMNQSYNFVFLNVSFNNISQIDINAFRNAFRLEELYIQHNILSTLPSNIFMNLKLKALDLSYNQLSLYQKGENNDWLHIFSPLSLSKVLINYNPWPCDTLREIILLLQSRKINIGDYNELNNNQNILGIECNDSFNKALTQPKDNDGKIEYLQKNILSLREEITQIHNNALQLWKITNTSLNAIINKHNSNIVDKQFTYISPLLKICNSSKTINVTECLIKFVKNIEKHEISDINLKLYGLSKQLTKFQEQNNNVIVTQSYTSSVIFDILLFLILMGILYIVYQIHKSNVGPMKRDQIVLT